VEREEFVKDVVLKDMKSIHYTLAEAERMKKSIRNCGL